MRKLLSVILTLALSLAVVPSGYAAEEKTDNTAFERNLALVQTLGADIPQDVTADKLITRGAFVKYAMDMYDRDFSASAGKGYYKDVTASVTGAAEINAATDMGIVSGKADRYFRPEEYVTYNEGMKIACEILGYNDFAVEYGGWSTGYLSIADSLDLTDGIKQTSEQMNYADALRLIVNMANARVLETDIVKKEITISEKSFLEFYRDIVKVKGRVTANEITGLYDTADAGAGKVIIGAYTYLIGETNANAYLGYEVTAYIDTENDDTLVYIGETGSDKVTEFSGSDIDDYINGSLVYTEGEREKKLKLSAETPVIYNMCFAGNAANTDIKAYIGNAYSVSVLTAKDGSTVLFIKEYTTIVADYANEASGIIYGKYGKSFTLPDDAEIETRFLGEDKKTSLASISKGNVLEIMSVSAGSGNEKVYITIVDYPFKAYITGIKKDGSKTIWKMDGTEYTVADSLLTSGETLPKKGDKIVCYVDSLSRIVGISYAPEVDYGYFTRAWRDDEDEDKIFIQLYTADGAFESFECKEKLTIGDLEKQPAEDILTTVAVNQLVMYDTNTKGLITEIKTAKDVIPTTGTNAGMPSYDFNNFSLDYKVQGASAYLWRVYLRQETAYGKSSFAADDSVVIFDIPKNLTDKKGFKIRSRSEFSNAGSLPSGAKVYDIDEYGFASAIVIERAGATVEGVGSDGKMGIFKEVVTAYSEEYGDCWEITFYDQREPVLAPIDELEYDSTGDSKEKAEDIMYGYGKIDIENLKEGDILEYAVDNKGNMTSYRVMLRPDDTTKMTYRGGLVSAWWLCLGKVKKSDGSTFSVIDSADGALRSFSFDAALAASVRKEGNHVWIYDSQKGTAKAGTLEDIREGDTVYTRIKYGILMFIMIIR